MLDKATLERKIELEQELARIRQLELIEKAKAKQAAVALLAIKTDELNKLYEECEKLARGADIEFYFHSGYTEFVTDANSSWNSSRC